MSALPIKHDLSLAYAPSLLVAVLIVVVSIAGLMFESTGLYRIDPKAALGVTSSTAGILVPGTLAHDALNLVVGLPVLLVCLWLARRGSLSGLLLWPGALFYVLYTYAQYLIGTPFSILFLPYVVLVTLSVYTVIGLVASIDGEAVRERLEGIVPARTVGGILVGLALLTLAQDSVGALTTALASSTPIDPVAKHVWIADLTIVVPAMLIGGVLLWRRRILGYVAALGLLLQFGLTPVVLAAIIALQPYLASTTVDVATVVGLLVFAAAAFVPLVFLIRATAQQRSTQSDSARPAKAGYADGQL